MSNRAGSYGVTDEICEERRYAISKQIEVAVGHEREMREADIRVRDEALVAQAREYERRLTDLNHNLRMMLDDRKTFLTREMFDTFIGDYGRFRDETRQHQTTVATWGAAGLVALGILQFALHILLK